MSAFGGKADMAYCTAYVRFLTQSGHGSPEAAPFPSASADCYRHMSQSRGKQ